MKRKRQGGDTLFPLPESPRLEDWRIVVDDAANVLAHASGAALVHIDPPWTYSNTVSRGAACKHYDGLSMEEIAMHVESSYATAAQDAYLLLWTTWPKIGEWIPGSSALSWRLVTGGSWHKSGRIGAGFHVRGDSEPWLLYVKGHPKPRGPLSNAFACPRTEHSEKPAVFLQQAIEAFTDPGDLVLDIYAGRGPCGVAARLSGRRYVGIEYDPERAELARYAISAAGTRHAHSNTVQPMRTTKPDDEVSDG